MSQDQEHDREHDEISAAFARADRGPLQLRPATKTDYELAREHKTKIIEALQAHLVPLIQAARNDGFNVQWQLGLDGLGRVAIAGLGISKSFDD